MVIGFAGTFFGGLIKASVSRQREYLADATAVQFTPQSGRHRRRVEKNRRPAAEARKWRTRERPRSVHAFFAQGVSGFMQALSATHPPLAKRIRRIDPQWDGKFDDSDASDPPRGRKKAHKAGTRDAGTACRQGRYGCRRRSGCRCHERHRSNRETPSRRQSITPTR